MGRAADGQSRRLAWSREERGREAAGEEAALWPSNKLTCVEAPRAGDSDSEDLGTGVGILTGLSENCRCPQVQVS